ncbi:hypothetical protein [Natronobiforma cellulositropha]|uniref:hypothetical protein n=1 Tax=Natronobiforma cellulositropha TaxID=1679076 RepID=UPI0021D5AD4C|nr:hypothetical protein [Natronobiforma cellulositropha]
MVDTDGTETTGSERSSGDDRATRVVVSYPEDLSSWGQFQLEKSSYRAFLTKVYDEAHEGDRWEEFVDVGCCGSSLDVTLRVERVEGGPRLDEETDLEYVARGPDGVEGSWRVQSEGGPSRA